MARRRNERGSVAVEAAIVLPLVLFLLLGAVQLHFLHQARVLASYAAYRAARAGALHGVDSRAMEAAALSALVPASGTPEGGLTLVKPVERGEDYGRRLVELGRGIDGLPVVEVTVCGPLRRDFDGTVSVPRPDGSGIERQPVAVDGEVDFDDPRRVSDAFDRWNPAASGDEATERFQRGLLRVQVTWYYAMTVPFAADVIHAIWRAKPLASVLGLGRGADGRPDGSSGEHPAIAALARDRVFVLPIRAEAQMRMQSNFRIADLPVKNECRSWARGGLAP
jgi:hypothetical protein